MRRYSLKSYLAPLMASALLLLAISPTSALATGTPIPRSKLFVFLQGIDSFLTSDQAAANGRDGSDPYFFGTAGIFKRSHLGTYLQSQGYSNARYLGMRQKKTILLDSVDLVQTQNCQVRSTHAL